MGAEPLPKAERGDSCRALTALFPRTSACRSTAARKALHQRRGHVCAALAERRIQRVSGDARAQTLLAERRLCSPCALPPVASGCASTGVYICNTPDCIAVPRHLYKLQPAAAPQVAGATQMSTRRPGCRFYFPENPKWRHDLKKKEKWRGEKSIYSTEIGFKWIFHVFTWKSNQKGGSLYICWTYFNDFNTLNPVFLTELRMGWLLIFHYNGNLTTFTFECDGVLLTSPNLQPTTWHWSNSCLLYLFIYLLFLVILYWIKI